MATAFPGPYAPDSPEMEEFAQSSSPSPKGAASQGEPGATAFGGSSGSYLSGPAKKGQGEAAKRDFGMMWMEATDEDKDGVVNSVAEPLAAQGVSLEGGVAQALKKGGPHAMAAAQRWGIDLNNFAEMLNPQQQQQGGPTGDTPKAFKSDEASQESKALTSQYAQADKVKNKKIQQRRAMGGFLMELGINILSSQRGDAAGAIGEGLKTTFTEKRARTMEDEDRTAAQTEFERQKKRQVRSDEMAEETHKREGLEKITTKDGKVIFADIAGGVVKDPDTGEDVRELTSADLSASATRAAQDALARAKQSTATRLDRLLKDGDQRVEKIQDALDDNDSELADRLSKEWIDGELAEYNYAASATETGAIDFSTLPVE